MAAKVLLLRPDRAGDALKTLPALRALVALRPDLDLHLLASPHNHSLFVNEPGITLHRLSENWGKLSGIWDVVISLPCDEFPENESLLASISSTRKFSVGMKNIRFEGGSPEKKDERANIAAILAQVLEPKVETEWKNQKGAPFLSAADHEEADRLLAGKTGKWLAVCPLASLARRSAPVHTWEKVCGRIFRSGVFDRYFLVTDPAGRTVAERWKKLGPPGKVDLLEASSFRALGAYLIRMDGVVAVDSGPLHFARCLERPTLAISSGGDWRRWHVPELPKSLLLKRGLFTSHPTWPEITLAYRRWTRRVF